MVAVKDPQTLQEAVEYFSDAANCHAYMIAQRWPDGTVTCPTCGKPDPRWLANQNRFECRFKHPRRQFSVKVGTIFEDSPIALKSWLLAAWMIANCKNGISSYEIARAIGVTQKTGWFMLHRIRLAMQNEDGGKLDGEIEIDETYIGGKARFMHKADRARKITKTGVAGKAAVMGLLQRHEEKGKSKVRARVIPNNRRPALTAVVEKNVEDGATVYTDELKSYGMFSVYYQHHVINHAESYVNGQVHTNGMENFWSLLKRAIKGTYVSVEPFHLFRYLDEEAFRFNERGGNDGDRFKLTMRQVTGRRVTYEQLTGGSEEEARA